MLTVITWLWGERYSGHYVDRLRNGVARHLKQEHRFFVCRPPAEDRYLTQIPGCLARLRTFDPAWQARNGIKPGDRIVCLDLDLVVTGGLDEIFNCTDYFAILQGVHTANPCPYNGSVWMLRAGYRPDVWSHFTVENAAAVPFYLFPEDQAWFAAKMPGAGALGPAQGVYAYGKPGWPKGNALPAGARIVAFPGHRDPAHFAHLDWVRKHWA